MSVASPESLTNQNYNQFHLVFTAYGREIAGAITDRKFRVNMVPDDSTLGPIVAVCDILVSESCVDITRARFEEYSPYKGPKLKLAIKCFIYGLCKYCRSNSIPKLSIEHDSPIANGILLSLGLKAATDRNTGTTTYTTEIEC